MATKNTVKRFLSKGTFSQKFDDDHGVPTSYSYSYPLEAEIAVDCYRTGISNPKWRSIIKSGGDATTPMDGVDYKMLSNSPCSGGAGINLSDESGSSHYLELFSGTIPLYLNMPGDFTVDPTVADNQALSRTFKALSQNRRQTQGLVFLGELRETLAFLKRPYAGARKLIDSYFDHLGNLLPRNRKPRSRNPKGTKWLFSDTRSDKEKFLKEASGAWLETAFGLMPLLNDVKEIAQTVARFQYDSRRSVVVGFGKDEAGGDGEYIYNLGSISAVMGGWKDITSNEVRYKVTLTQKASADFGSASRLMELSGVTLQDFVPALWELAPWSFLADYFTNIGDIIEAGCTSQEDVSFVLRTERRKSTRSATYQVGHYGEMSDGHFEVSGSIGKSVIERSYVMRTSAGSLAIPSFEVSLPGRPNQWANMAALWGARQTKIARVF
jgi:hypothetical protein